MDSNPRMIAWSSTWALFGGLVLCKGCVQAKPVSLCGEIITHKPCCKARGEVAEMRGLNSIRSWIFSAGDGRGQDGMSTLQTTGQLRKTNQYGSPVRKAW